MNRRTTMIFIRLALYLIVRLPLFLSIPYSWFYGIYDLSAIIFLIFIDKIVK